MIELLRVMNDSAIENNEWFSYWE